MAQKLQIKPNFDGQEKMSFNFAFVTANSAERFALTFDSFNATSKEAKFTPVGLTANACAALDIIVTDSKGNEVRTPINVASPAQVIMDLSPLTSTDKIVYCQLRGKSKTIGKDVTEGGKAIDFANDLAAAYTIFEFRYSPV